MSKDTYSETHSRFTPLILPLAGLGVALVFAAFFILITGNNPLSVYGTIISSIFGSLNGFTSMLRWMIPILILSVSASFSLRGGLWNLGMEGQMYVGALFSTWVGFSFPGLPGYLIIVLGFLTAAVAGFIWVLVPALLKAFFSVNEFITSLLLNFVAVLLTDFFAIALWQDRSVGGQTLSTHNIAPQAEFSPIIPGYSWHTGFFLAIILLLAYWFVMKYSSLGYEIKIHGHNPRFLKYGGGSSAWTTVKAMGISGAIAGIAGFVEIYGVNSAFYTKMFSGGIAWDGLVAALLGMLQPVGILFSSFLFGFLKIGLLRMERFTDISRSIVTIIQAFIIFFIAARASISIKRAKKVEIKEKGDESK